MSKINSAYNFLFHPLHKDSSRKHDRTKRSLTLIASVAAGVFSLSFSHIVVFAMHRHRAKKLDAQPNYPAPSSSIKKSKKEKDPFKLANSTSSSSEDSSTDEDVRLARILQAEEEESISLENPRNIERDLTHESSEGSTTDEDVRLAKALQEAEYGLNEEADYMDQSLELARRLQEQEHNQNMPPEFDNDDATNIAIGLSLQQARPPAPDPTIERNRYMNTLDQKLEELEAIKNLPLEKKKEFAEGFIKIFSQKTFTRKNPKIYFLLGVCYETRADAAREDLKHAELSYKTAATLKQNTATFDGQWHVTQENDPIHAGKAFLHLARGYESGIFGRIDHKEALDCYMKAALRGNADAQYWLGKWYMEKDKNDIHTAQARLYLSKAAEQGHELAKMELEKLPKH